MIHEDEDNRFLSILVVSQFLSSAVSHAKELMSQIY